jgi:hypothetical protein
MDRQSLEQHWDAGVVATYKRITPPASSCVAGSEAALRCDEMTGLYCEASKIQIELYARGDPHLAEDCAGASLAMTADHLGFGFGFQVKRTEQWSELLTAPKLPSQVAESAGARTHNRKVLIVQRIKPNNLFHHFESMIAAYISLTVKGWEDLPAQDIDVMLVDVSAFRRVRPPVPRSTDETMSLAVWSMFGAVRKTPLFAMPFKYINDHFTKTGSGQT